MMPMMLAATSMRSTMDYAANVESGFDIARSVLPTEETFEVEHRMAPDWIGEAADILADGYRRHMRT